MNMKKPLALLLATGITPGLAAYGNGSRGNSESPASGGETGNSSTGAVELNLWSFNVGRFTETPNWEPIIATFNEQNPDIRITITPINYQDSDQELASAIIAGTSPDIIFEGPEHIVGNYAREDLMVDLSDLWETGGSDVTRSVSSVSRLNGTYYMYPLSVAAHCMAINCETFETAGALQYIDEGTRIWATDSFVKAMGAVRDAAAAGTINISTPSITYCDTQGGDQGTRALVNNLCFDYFINKDGTAYTANSENNVEALKLLQDMVNNGSMSANTSFATADELQAFASQTCAVSFCWNYISYTRYAAQTQFILFTMAFPFGDGKPELEMVDPYGFGVFNNKDGAKTETAKRFVQFVCDDRIVEVEAVKAAGFFPVRSDWGDVYTGDADAGTHAPFALMSDYLGRYYNLTGGWTEQRGYWWPMLTEIMTTGADIQTAADKCAAQANTSIG